MVAHCDTQRYDIESMRSKYRNSSETQPNRVLIFVPAGNGVGWSDPKLSSSTANLQATCDYPQKYDKWLTC